MVLPTVFVWAWSCFDKVTESQQRPEDNQNQHLHPEGVFSTVILEQDDYL